MLGAVVGFQKKNPFATVLIAQKLMINDPLSFKLTSLKRSYSVGVKKPTSLLIAMAHTMNVKTNKKRGYHERIRIY